MCHFSRYFRKKTWPQSRVLVSTGPKKVEFGTFWSVIRDYGLKLYLYGDLSPTMLFKSPVLIKTAFRDQFLRFLGFRPQKLRKYIPYIFPIYW